MENVFLTVPLYQNKGPYCTEYSLKGMLEYFSITLSTKKIIRGINRKGDKLISPIEIIPFLHQEKIGFYYPYKEKELIETLNSDLENKMREFYGYRRGGKMFQKISSENLLRCMGYVLEQKLGTNKKIDVEYLECALEQENIPLLLINFNLLNKERNELKGHYIYLVGCDSTHFIYHDTGPISLTKEGKIRKENLEELQKLTWFDYSTIIIKGNKQESH